MHKTSKIIRENNRRVLNRMQTCGDDLMIIPAEQTWFPKRENIEKLLITKIMIDVIIPSKTVDEKHELLLKNCIDSLRASEKKIKFNVIVIESGPEIKSLGQDTTIRYGNDVFCYNRALNLGLIASLNKWVVFANNDLIFEPGWMHEIIIAHNLRRDIESFSPWNDQWGWHQGVYGPNPVPDIIEGYRIGAELCGWCIVARRSIFFEKNMKLCQTVNFWYSDNVYSDELKKLNIKHALVTRSKVKHLVSQTTQLTGEQQREAYDEYMKQKE